MREQEHYLKLMLSEEECFLLADSLSVFADCEPFDERIEQALDMADGIRALAIGLRGIKQQENDVRLNGEP